MLSNVTEKKKTICQILEQYVKGEFTVLYTPMVFSQITTQQDYDATMRRYVSHRFVIVLIDLDSLSSTCVRSVVVQLENTSWTTCENNVQDSNI